ncbi:hypothetical protein JVT61DRAFT_9005 [Boletus reticuloceps]|uniref:Uncharacterized protein n=1 Tax=Boletus reticuloceps TaxID=495285 RepID=A0A8I2YHQ9_9AGAM|nr:hypothetical protein JVT61DRAFT_9005 [Boletus reticuloceps]
MVGKKKDETSSGATKSGTTTTTKKTTKIAETCLLDERPSGPGKLEESVARKGRLEQRARKAIIGYARVDVIEKKSEFKFGEWNTRRLETAQVSRLVQSFLTKGVDRFSMMKAIPLVVSLTDVKTKTYVTKYDPDMDSMRDLPILELQDAAKGKQRLLAAGGQHRVHAVVEWVKFMRKRHSESVRDRQTLEKQNVEAVSSTEIEQENNVRKAKRDTIEETLALGGQWIVVLYDAGKVDKALGLHLAENESDHVYRQTPEEGLLHTFRTMNVNGETCMDVEPKEGVKGAPRKCLELLSQDYVWELMKWIEPMGLHMFNSRADMKLHTFHNTMMGTGGGIIAYMVVQMERYVCQCFNDVKVDEKEVDRLIAEAVDKESPEGKKALDALFKIYVELEKTSNKMIGARGARYEIRQCMDDAFEQHLGSLTEVSVLFANQRSHRWQDALQNYLTEVIEELPKVIKTTELPVHEDDRAAIESLRWCVAKVKILRHMLARPASQIANGLVPFMSRSVYTHMVTHLERIDQPLKEFCRWWDPLINMVTALGKYWVPGSESAAMVRAILCHRDIANTNRPMAVHRVIYVVWNDYGSFLNMGKQLVKVSVPPRISAQKKLLSLFGVNSQGDELPELRVARVDSSGTAVNKKKQTTTTKGKGKEGKGKDRKENENEKGKGKRKQSRDGKKKKNSTTKNDDDDDDDDNDDEDDDTDECDDDNDNSPSLDSNEEDDTHDGDRDKDERARIRRERYMMNHRAIISRHTEWLEVSTLLTESRGDGRGDKKAPVLNFTKSPPSFIHTWKKLSRVSIGRSTVTTRGLALVNSTTWEWMDLPRNTFSRVMRSLAAAAIAESSVISSYRHEIICCHERGGAASLRIRVRDAVASLLMDKDPGQTSEMCQTSLKDLFGSASQGSKEVTGTVFTEGSLPPKGCITWADGIYPIEPNGGVALHVVDDEIARFERESSLGHQQRAVQKIVDSVQRSQVAWHDPTGRAQERDEPPLDEDVALALRMLVESLNVNAYRQRVKETRTLDFESNEARAPTERLRVIMRSDSPVEDDDECDDDDFLFGVPKKIQQQDIFTKGQSTHHLEELCTKYNAWILARQKRKKTSKCNRDDDSGVKEETGESDGEENTEHREHVEETGEGEDNTEYQDNRTCEDNFDPELFSFDPKMYDDLPTNSQGDFLSDIPPPSNQLAARHKHVDRPTARMYLTSASQIRHPRSSSPALEDVSEVEETETDKKKHADMVHDPITDYTNLNDGDDDKDSDGNREDGGTTDHHTEIVATQIVSSDSRAHNIAESRKRERALTMSSTSSKDNKADEVLVTRSSKHAKKRLKPSTAAPISSSTTTLKRGGSSSVHTQQTRKTSANPAHVDESSYIA